MEDIKNLNQEEIKQLEEEIKNIFINSESKDQEIKNQKIVSKRIFHDEVDNNINRSSSEEFKFKFNDKLKPKYLESEKGIKNYIIISGGFLIPVEFMNYLINKIFMKFQRYCDIHKEEDSLKFLMIFHDIEEVVNENNQHSKELEKLNMNSENDEDEDDDEEEKSQEINKECNIQVKLFKLKSGDYLLRLLKKQGDLEDYYNNVSIIINFIKSII